MGNESLNHCIIRGIDKRDIFFDNQDRKKYLKVLIQSKEKYKIKVGTFSLMQNHVHLILKGNSEDVANFFHSMLISYSAYFNKKYERTGHLFENRYRNKIISDQAYLRNVVKYIHFNPEKAGICRATEYKWSGYQDFFKKDAWIDKDIILPFYGNDIDEALNNLKIQHNDGLDRYYEDYVEYEMVNGLTDEQVKIIIDDRCSKYDKNDFRAWENIYKNIIIKEVLDLKGVSINQINRITGINRRELSKIKRTENKSTKSKR